MFELYQYHQVEHPPAQRAKLNMANSTELNPDTLRLVATLKAFLQFHLDRKHRSGMIDLAGQRVLHPKHIIVTES